MSAFPDDALRTAMAHCEAAYPNEGCGVFLQQPDGRIEGELPNDQAGVIVFDTFDFSSEDSGS